MIVLQLGNMDMFVVFEWIHCACDTDIAVERFLLAMP